MMQKLITVIIFIILIVSSCMDTEKVTQHNPIQINEDFGVVTVCNLNRLQNYLFYADLQYVGIVYHDSCNFTTSFPGIHRYQIRNTNNVILDTLLNIEARRRYLLFVE